MKYFSKQRYYGKHREVLKIPNLIELQLKSYEDFLQLNTPSINRDKGKGLQKIIEEIFPIENYEKTITLNFIGYELGKPRYSHDECRKLKLTYGAPFKMRLLLDENGRKLDEDEVYLGELPLMIGGGEFIINGADRVIVSQLHRSPGVDFSEESDGGEKRLHSCWIIPERGSWIDISATKKETLVVQIDKSGKFPATVFLRAWDEKYATDEAILKLFYKTEKISLRGKNLVGKLTGKILAVSLELAKEGELEKNPKDKEEQETFRVPAGSVVTESLAQTIVQNNLSGIEVLKPSKDGVLDQLIVNTLAEDPTSDANRDIVKEPDPYRLALYKIYARLRPGNPFSFDKAKLVFAEKFQDSTRYSLGRVGRFRLNRKFKQNVKSDHMVLAFEDVLNAIRYILGLRCSQGETDDIDHLGNRRVRTIVELAGEELRKGFLKLKRTIQERMSGENTEQLVAKNLINPKTISAAIDYFFGRGELSQVIDQTNPLAQLTHERRLSALGPGGLNRKRAGFDVRDVHISHYGRICPIETPEGTNIGLISSLSIFANIDEYGFLVTPYRVVKDGMATDEVRYLRADEEQDRVLAPADTPLDKKGKFVSDKVIARINGDYKYVSPEEVDYCDVSPKQLVGVSASLIPFLEHDDANRALMGSNMQRQAVPLLITEPPLVATGMERVVAQNSSMVVHSKVKGTVIEAAGDHILIREDNSDECFEYPLTKFFGLNDRTCLNQKPIVREGDRVKPGDIIADGSATSCGELALGRNVLVAFMPWDGYNFEDAVILSEKLVKEDYYTSIHIEEFSTEIRETKMGREEFTKDIPNVSERSLSTLDENGIVKIGTCVKSGDILVGKVAPKGKTELTPEEKLLHAIFGRAGEDVKNESLKVPSGVEGIVIETKKFARKVKLTEEERKNNLKEIKRFDKIFSTKLRESLFAMMREVVDILGEDPINLEGNAISWPDKDHTLGQLKQLRNQLNIYNLKIDDPKKRQYVAQVIKRHMDIIGAAEDQKVKQASILQSGDELPTGVLEMVKVYVAAKRILSVGDKMAGRHGNKGVISKILPEEDMPYLEDGTPVEILLNPLGVPSRMNVGQILETHLGWAAKQLGFQAITPVFDGCKESEIEEVLQEAGLSKDGTSVLYDGRTGEPFDQKPTIGYIYMMKLYHLVEDKVHARATGPYSLITQQPLGGKSRFGGQRFGEMEVWALEAYGAAHLLQELLTVKSDDVEGRTKIYESMVKGENTLEPGTPVSFEVLTYEIKGLGLDIQLNKGSKRILDE